MSLIATPHGIRFVQLCARIGAIKLEMKGLKRHGRSAYSISKQVYNLKGNRESVLRQMEALREEALNERKSSVSQEP